MHQPPKHSETPSTWDFDFIARYKNTHTNRRHSFRTWAGTHTRHAGTVCVGQQRGDRIVCCDRQWAHTRVSHLILRLAHRMLFISLYHMAKQQTIHTTTTGNCAKSKIIHTVGKTTKQKKEGSHSTFVLLASGSASLRSETRVRKKRTNKSC